MKVGIMQPYIFPYIGYFQLIHAVDLFVFYDDVSFIKQGWINRNRVLLNKEPFLFTIPLQNISSFSEIKDTYIHNRNFALWKEKFVKSLRQSYAKAPQLHEVIPLVEDVLNIEAQSIATLAIGSIKSISSYLGMERTFKISSMDYPKSKGLNKADRLIQICHTAGSQHYINPSGGSVIYEKSYFRERGIRIDFIKPSGDIFYKQVNDSDFVPWLSIIDVLMFNNKQDVNRMLTEYSFT